MVLVGVLHWFSLPLGGLVGRSGGIRADCCGEPDLLPAFALEPNIKAHLRHLGDYWWFRHVGWVSRLFLGGVFE